MSWTDDPLADYDRYSDQQEREQDKLPKCDYCDEPITDDFYFEINGDVICEECLNDNFRKAVDSY